MGKLTRYAVPTGVTPLAFDAMLAYRDGTIILNGRRRMIGVRFPGGRTITYPLKPGEDWEDGCRWLHIL